MRLPSPTIHRWDLSPSEAIAFQNELRYSVMQHDHLPESVQRVAGVDVGFEERGTITRAAVALLDYPTLTLVESRIARRPTQFPYVPGLLSFREIPAILDALSLVEQLPDLILVDGQGMAHPRRLGIASHLGILTGIPTIGVGKIRLIGTHAPVPESRGDWVPLMDKGERIGAVLRTRVGVRPVYVSPGHRVCLETALYEKIQVARDNTASSPSCLGLECCIQWALTCATPNRGNARRASISATPRRSEK